jgi:hypothetical protein
VSRDVRMAVSASVGQRRDRQAREALREGNPAVVDVLIPPVEGSDQ